MGDSYKLKFLMSNLEDMQKSAEPVDTLHALLDVADAYRESSDYEEAMTYYQKASEIIDANPCDPEYVSRLLYGLGDAHSATGDFDTAIQLFAQDIALLSEYNNPARKALVLDAMGDILSLTESHSDALKMHKTALTHYQIVDDVPSEVFVLLDIARDYLGLGKRRKALKRLNTARRLSEEYGLTNGKAWSEYLLGLTLMSCSDYDSALELFASSLEEAEKLQDFDLLSNIVASMGNVYQSKGLNTKADECFAQALTLKRSSETRG